MQVRDLLAMFPQLRLRAGAEGTDGALHWVHVVEQPDVANWLRNGDLALVSGLGWPRDPEEQRRTVRQMAEAGVAGALFATGRFLADVPEVVLSEAERLGFPVIEAPFDLRFADIAESAQRTIIGEYFEVMERADAIHRALTLAALTAGDLWHLAERLAEVLSVEAAIFASDGAPLARAGGEKGGGPLGAQALGAVTEAPSAQLPMRLRVQGREALLMPLSHGAQRIGVLMLRREEGAFGPLEERVIQHAAAVIALHVLHQEEIAEVERRIHASFLEALLFGAYPAEDLAARERVRLHGLDPDRDFRIVIARLELAGPALSSMREFELRRSLAGIIEAQCQAVGIRVLTTMMLSRVVVLWPAGAQDRPMLEEIYERAAAAVGGELVLAAGEAQRGIGGIPKSYDQAERMLLLAGPTDGLILFEDHLLLRLLMEIDERTLREFRDSVLGPLDAERNGQALIETVRTLADCSFNQVQAAHALGLHRNTLRQRMRRVEQVLGRPLGDPETLARIHLAIAAGRLLPKRQ